MKEMLSYLLKKKKICSEKYSPKEAFIELDIMGDLSKELERFIEVDESSIHNIHKNDIYIDFLKLASEKGELPLNSTLFQSLKIGNLLFLKGEVDKILHSSWYYSQIL